MELKGVQILAVLIALAFLLEAHKSYRAGKFKKSDYLLWGGASFVLIFISLFPVVTSGVLAPLIAGRGLDAILMLGLLGAYGILFRIYLRIEETNRQMTEMTRKIAIKLKNK